MSEPARVTKQDLIEDLARVIEAPQKEAEVILETILSSIVRALRAGEKVELRGFGSFRTRQRGARVGRNPMTGAAVQVPAKKIPAFKPSKDLAALLNGPRPEDGSRG